MCNKVLQKKKKKKKRKKKDIQVLPWDCSSIGGTGYSSFFGGNLIKVGGNKLTSLTS